MSCKHGLNVIASEAKQSHSQLGDCFGACPVRAERAARWAKDAPRNDGSGGYIRW